MGTEGSVAILSNYKTQNATAQNDVRLAKQPLVLVVEDEVLVRMSVSSDLRAHGFSVIEAHDADEAVQVLKLRDDVDVVFSDIVMPGHMNGADLALTWMRQHKPTLPVLLTSGVAHGLLSVKGTGTVLPKPYDIDRVAETLRALIASRTTH
jgi:CheY-like chemotaxis protein